MPEVTKDITNEAWKKIILKQAAKVEISLQIKDNPLKTNSRSRDYKFAITPH